MTELLELIDRWDTGDNPLADALRDVVKEADGFAPRERDLIATVIEGAL